MVCYKYGLLQIIKVFRMGSTMCTSEDYIDTVDSFGPILSTFTLISSEKIKLQEKYEKILTKIKTYFDYPDARQSPNYKWYQSNKYHLYLYGTVLRDRPVGTCFFYTMNTSSSETPIAIATKIDQKYFYFENPTLVLYSDQSFYFGELKTELTAMPTAQGHGTLISKDFTYEGDFKNGFPHGKGTYKSEYCEYTGGFRGGHPIGEGIEISAKGLFVGVFGQNTTRKGYLITPNNENIEVEEKDQNSSKLFASHLFPENQ